MFSLVIVESPAKCKKIEEYLGKEYKCIASYGHIRELDTKNGLECIDIHNNFKPSFKNIPVKMKNIRVMKELVGKSKDVYLATDDDREGDAIAWHLCQVLHLPVDKTKRILFHEITKDALTKAIRHPTHLNMKSVESQQARQTLDILIGFTISPMLWKYLNQYRLSAGRCQSVALRLIYENHLALKSKQGKYSYEVTGFFTDKEIPFHLNAVIEEREQVDTFLEETVNHDHHLSLSKIKEKRREPPVPFTTSLIQQRAHSLLHYSPKDTMKICQNLYEAGYITYMRTDCKKYSKEFVDKVSSFIGTKWGGTYVREDIEKVTNSDTISKEKKKKKDHAQEAHEAIRPTNILKVSLKDEAHTKIGVKEIKMYHLIWCNTVESCMSSCVYDTVVGTITSPFEKHQYKHTFEQIRFVGWCIVEEVYQKKNIYEKDELYEYILEHDKDVSYTKIKCDYSLRDRGQHYTESTLVSLLEKNGIGRPSTYSSLVSKVQERNYVSLEDVEGEEIECIDYVLVGNEIEEIPKKKKVGVERNKLVIQPIGIMVMEYLLKYYDDIFNYEYTASMEERLDNIRNGKSSYVEVCQKGYEDIIYHTEKVEETPVEFSLQDRENTGISYTYKVMKYGPVIVKKVDGKVSYLKVKKDVDMEKVKEKKYCVEDIIEAEDTRENVIGEHEGKEIVIRKGKYGLYCSWNGGNYSLKKLGNKELHDVSKSDFLRILTREDDTSFRLTDDISLRNGKYGVYIYYKTKKMKKAKFISARKCPYLENNIDLQTLDLDEFEKEKIILWCLNH